MNKFTPMAHYFVNFLKAFVHFSTTLSLKSNINKMLNLQPMKNVCTRVHNVIFPVPIYNPHLLILEKKTL